MKQIIRALSCFLVLAVLLTGCSHPSRDTEPVQSGHIEHIVVTYPIGFDAKTEGLPEVQAAINAITIPELGIEVELRKVDASKTANVYPNSITLGEQIDLMVLNSENIEGYVNKDMLLPLGALLESYGQGIRDINDTYAPLFDGTSINGTIYGVGVPSGNVGLCGGLWINKSLLEEVSFRYNSERIYSLEDLDLLFSRIKEAYPDSYPLGQITSTYSFSTYSFYLGVFCDGLRGGDYGVLELDGTQVVNLYELPQYKQLLQYMRKWYLDGYIYPDSAITSASALTLYTSGIVKTIPMVGTPYILSDEVEGEELVCLRLSPIHTIRNNGTGVFWTIPVTSREPETAMRFLDMMYTDERIVNLLSWGISGRDYELDSDGTFHPLEDACYFNHLGLFGDQRLRYEIDGNTRKAVRAAFSSKAIPINQEYNDFWFDASDLSQEMLQIERVNNLYLKLLESGCVDYDTVYPEYIQALYDAGLQRVMDEKQCQFDLWLAENS